ncbi:C25 family cysteine peptidase [Candidatus Riflebacteria bacterium]
MRNSFKFILFLGLFFVSLSSVNAQWHKLDKGAAGKDINYDINARNHASQIITVTVPGYELENTRLNGKTYSIITVPEFTGLTIKGAPDLPRISENILIPVTESPKASIIQDEYVDIKLEHPILSSKGHMTRNINPDTIPHTFSDVYKKDAFFPEDLMVTVSTPFTAHNIHGAHLKFNLFQYNPVKKILRIHKNLVVSIKNQGQSKRLLRIKKVPPFVYDMLQSSFINFERMRKPLQLERATENGRMLVICYDDFLEAAQPWIVWKKKAGFVVKVVKMSEVGQTANDVKNYIKTEYNKGNLSYVHLIGDVEQIPTLLGTVESAHSDQSYGLVAGNDWFLDIIVSRFSAKTAEKVALQGYKALTYEAYPDTGAAASWYVSGMGIGSDEGWPTKDWKYCDKIRKSLLKFTFKKVDRIYDPGATPTAVTTGLNQGRSVINYIGHGASTFWGTTGFSNYDIKKLTNGSKLPYIWSVACVNGAFASSYDCFAETWLNAGTTDNMKGAVAIAAASTNMEWVPPIHWQAHINRVLLIKGRVKTFGGLNLNGMGRLASKYGATHKSFKMFVEQTNNFGDASIKVRCKVPAKVSLSSIERDATSLKLVLGIDKRGQDVKEFFVTIYNKKMDFWKTIAADRTGTVSFELGKKEDRPEELFLTVTGPDCVPIVDKRIY